MAKTNGQKLDNAKCGCAAGHRPSPPLLVKRRSAQPLCSARRSLPHLCLPYDPAVSILMFMQEKRKHMLTCKPVCEQVQWFSSSSLETGPSTNTLPGTHGRRRSGAALPGALRRGKKPPTPVRPASMNLRGPVLAPRGTFPKADIVGFHLYDILIKAEWGE